MSNFEIYTALILIVVFAIVYILYNKYLKNSSVGNLNHDGNADIGDIGADGVENRREHGVESDSIQPLDISMIGGVPQKVLHITRDSVGKMEPLAVKSSEVTFDYPFSMANFQISGKLKKFAIDFYNDRDAIFLKVERSEGSKDLKINTYDFPNVFGDHEEAILNVAFFPNEIYVNNRAIFDFPRSTVKRMRIESSNRVKYILFSKLNDLFTNKYHPTNVKFSLGGSDQEDEAS